MKTYRIPATDDGLLAECEVDTFRSSGPGGQNVNKRETAVRLRHTPSGMIVTCQRERSQHRNKQAALTNLREKLARSMRARRRRIRTSMPRRARERILAAKKRRGAKKKLRQTPSQDD